MIIYQHDLIGVDNGLFLTVVAATVFALLIGVAFHESCHAFMANALGDRTPAQQGRVTLNPLAHLEPFGTLMMLFFVFGWGKPVQFNPFGLRVSPKLATLLIAAAGPLSNLVAAFLLALPIKLGYVPFINPFATGGLHGGTEYFGVFLSAAVYLNVILGVFNLIPLEPLDGFKVAIGLLPDHLAQEYAKLRQYGVGPLMLLIFGIPIITSQINAQFHYNHGQGYFPLGNIMRPFIERMLTAVGIG